MKRPWPCGWGACWIKARSTLAAAWVDAMSSEQTLEWTEEQTLQYWWSMRRAMESAGDRSSAIYLRSVAITEGQPDPLAIEINNTTR